VSPDGKTVIVTGSSETAPVYEYDYLTIAYSAGSGQFLWSARYAPQQMASQPVALVVSPDGTKVFVSGGSYGATGTLKDYATVAYNASTGAPLWTQRYDGNFQHDYATALAVSRDSTMAFVTGWSIAASGGGDYTTIAYSGSTGGVLWTKRYNGPGNGPDYANALAVGPDGRKLFVTGTSYGSATSGYDYATVAYSVR
jgi:WD40 repeat protein